MRYLICLIALFYLALPAGNARAKTARWNISLHTGDLLFCSTTSGELSKAIDQATQTVNKTHFDHVGIVELAEGSVWVLHAAPKKGVSREPIESFLSTGEEPVNVTAYRLRNQYSKAIPAAINTPANPRNIFLYIIPPIFFLYHKNLVCQFQKFGRE